MRHVLTVCLLTVGLAGCGGGFPTPPVEVVDAEPYDRDAAVIEHGLVRENRTPYQCDPQKDTAILCQGVKRKLD